MTAEQSGIVRVATAKPVAEAMDALQAAVTAAGAAVFACVDHAGGAAKAGMELAPCKTLIFGNPQLGTPAMQDDRLAGLALPMKVLAYEDDAGQAWLAYEAPSAMLGRFDGIAADADYVAKMAGALAKLTAAAAA